MDMLRSSARRQMKRPGRWMLLAFASYFFLALLIPELNVLPFTQDIGQIAGHKVREVAQETLGAVKDSDGNGRYGDGSSKQKHTSASDTSGAKTVTNTLSATAAVAVPQPSGISNDAPYKKFQLFGFSNTGKPVNVSCDRLRLEGEIEVQDGYVLEDDMVKIALELDSHPMIAYPDGHLRLQNTDIAKLIEPFWLRLSGSSVWLEKYGVFLTVSRVMFIRGGWNAPRMSFLRGQIHDKDWKHLENYDLKWKEKTLNFPLFFDIDAEYKLGGELFGSEDPRIIIEEDVKDAEPVIVYNMISSKTGWKRAMWIFRPFSGVSTPLTVRGEARAETEKNWAPLFLRSPARGSEVDRQPSKHIHMLYSFAPLRILYCSLKDGMCDMVYSQAGLHDGLKTKHRGAQDSLRGGTNFVPMPLAGAAENMHAWVALPRTHITGAGCNGGHVYRPMLTVLINIGEQFFLAFASNSLDFGHALVHEREPACGGGWSKILIPNSIAKWERDGNDEMTVTFSVNDRTVHVARIRGILKFLDKLPWQELLGESDLGPASENFLRNMELSAVGNDVEACAVEAATNYTHIFEKGVKVWDEELTMRMTLELEEMNLRLQGSAEKKQKYEKLNHEQKQQFLRDEVARKAQEAQKKSEEKKAEEKLAAERKAEEEKKAEEKKAEEKKAEEKKAEEEKSGVKEADKEAEKAGQGDKISDEASKKLLETQRSPESVEDARKLEEKRIQLEKSIQQLHSNMNATVAANGEKA